MVKKYPNVLQFLLFFILLSVLPLQIYAQCAGNDGSKVICNIENPVNKTISLFALLGGTPTAGGTWSDDNNSRGLNPATGMLNAQLIRSGGVYHYTYTVAGVAGCTDNKSTITITIGSYPGSPSPFATECSSKETFNLFTAFNSTGMGPHSNGSWTNSAGQPVDAIIPITGLDGSFEFTYTVPAVAPCSVTDPSVKVTVTIFKAPEPGTGNDLLLCGSTDLAPYTNLDLHTLLAGEDMGGEWTGVGLTSLTDHNVNLQEIFDNFGPGEYTYNYTVRSFPDNRICPDKTTSVTITLEKRLDFTGAKLAIDSDICEDKIATATYVARITQGPEAIANGQYKVTFNVSGPNGGSETVTANFVNGVISFPLKSSYFKQVGTFIVNVTSIVATVSKGACVNIVANLSDDLKINPLPNFDGAVLTATPICQNKNAFIQISNAAQLSNGNYNIVYNITGDNFATGQTANIQVTGGTSGFVIPGNINIKSGVSTITIIKITNTAGGNCSNLANVQGNLIINPLPNAATVKVLVQDVCLNDPVAVAVSGLGNLTTATFSYTLSGNNSSTLQTVVLTVDNGNASFIIPLALVLNTGSTTISAISLKNNTTTCDVVLTSVSDNFLINSIPVAPTAGNQIFCKVDRATIANLVPRGSQYKWYSSTTATAALADSYLLKTEYLYLRETSAERCSSAPTMIAVLVNDTPAPILNTGGADFCGLENPTISDLSKATNVPSTVAWYDAEINGNLLASTTLLVHKARYYGFDLSAVTDCISDTNLEVTVSLIDCDVSQYAFFIPDGFSPNGDNINDTFRIPDIEYLYPDYTLEIFNRYGNVMFKGNISKPNWDGRNSEAAGFGDGIAPNGVYFYIINFNKDNRRPQQGRLYLNR
jgi:gliding motility-associated-like protein